MVLPAVPFFPHHPRRPSIASKRRRSSQLDPPLPPKPRKRTLTIPHSPDAAIAQNSILLMLPLEIRRHIWAEIVGGYIIHFIMPMRVLAHFVCPNPEKVVCGCRINEWKRYERLPKKVIAVLVTCRQM
jgi:hypothetical protein